MKKIVFITITLFFTVFGHASYIEVKDTIKNNTTWGGIDTVKVADNILVNNLVTLTIDAGIVVEFQGVYQIEVKGAVKAIGTETDSIVFTAHNKGNGWGHFLLSSVNAANDTSEFHYCIFEYSKPYNKTSGYTDGASFYLSNCNNLEISNNTFRYNKGTNTVINATSLAVAIYSNTFIHNESYCLLFTRTKQGNKIYNNKFINNTGGAAIYSGIDDITVYANNLMVNNYRGYFLYGSNAQILNSTVVGSSISGITFSGNSDARVQNSIFWDNFLELQIKDTASDPDFYNCDVEGGSAALIGGGSGSEFSGAYSMCLDSDPEFSDDFSLGYSSPCKDVGKKTNEIPEIDILGSERICDDEIDLGPYEYFVATDTVCDEIWGEVNDTVHVTGNIVVPSGCSLTVLPGTTVMFDGLYKITVQGVMNAVGATQADGQIKIDSIKFTAANKIEGWRGIKYIGNNSVDTSVFEYCVFEYGYPINHQGLSQKEGGAFYVSHFDNLEIKHCYIHHCKGLNGVIFSTGDNFEVSNCLFSGNGNYTVNIIGAGSAVIKNNKFFNNGCAVYSGYSDSSLYQNNLMVNNISGYAFYQSKARIINNTIYGCSSNPFVFINGSRNKVYNTIVYHNQSDIILKSIDDDPNFFNCNIEGGKESFTGAGSGSEFSGAYIECLDTVPKFIDSLNYDFRLKSCSPLVNKGIPDTAGLFLPETDLAGFTRVFGSRIDIGAFETDTSRVNVLIAPGETQTYVAAMSVKITFDKEVKGFDVSGLIITNGTAEITDTIDSNLAYILTIVADTFGTVTIGLPENSVADTFENTNIAVDTSYIYLEEDVDAITENSHTQMGFKLYPNPASNYTTLDLGRLTGLDIWYQLYDIHSRPVLTETISANPVVIDLSNIVAGTYFLKIMENNTEVRSFIVVKTW